MWTGGNLRELAEKGLASEVKKVVMKAQKKDDFSSFRAVLC